jgi:hypothetical protein
MMSRRKGIVFTRALWLLLTWVITVIAYYIALITRRSVLTSFEKGIDVPASSVDHTFLIKLLVEFYRA